MIYVSYDIVLTRRRRTALSVSCPCLVSVRISRKSCPVCCLDKDETELSGLSVSLSANVWYLRGHFCNELLIWFSSLCHFVSLSWRKRAMQAFIQSYRIFMNIPIGFHVRTRWVNFQNTSFISVYVFFTVADAPHFITFFPHDLGCFNAS